MLIRQNANRLVLDEYVRSNAALFELANHALRQVRYIRGTPMSDAVRDGMLDALIKTLSDGIDRDTQDKSRDHVE